jgi:hypothetical protein
MLNERSFDSRTRISIADAVEGEVAESTRFKPRAIPFRAGVHVRVEPVLFEKVGSITRFVFGLPVLRAVPRRSEVLVRGAVPRRSEVLVRYFEFPRNS